MRRQCRFYSQGWRRMSWGVFTLDKVCGLELPTTVFWRHLGSKALAVLQGRFRVSGAAIIRNLKA